MPCCNGAAVLSVRCLPEGVVIAVGANGVIDRLRISSVPSTELRPQSVNTPRGFLGARPMTPASHDAPPMRPTAGSAPAPAAVIVDGALESFLSADAAVKAASMPAQPPTPPTRKSSHTPAEAPVHARRPSSQPPPSTTPTGAAAGSARFLHVVVQREGPAPNALPVITLRPAAGGPPPLLAALPADGRMGVSISHSGSLVCSSGGPVCGLEVIKRCLSIVMYFLHCAVCACAAEFARLARMQRHWLLDPTA
jgi:hypothetical protein